MEVLGEHRFPTSNGVIALAICQLIIFIASNFESQTKYIYLSLFFFNLCSFQNISEDVWGHENFLLHCICPALGCYKHTSIQLLNIHTYIHNDKCNVETLIGGGGSSTLGREGLCKERALKVNLQRQVS